MAIIARAAECGTHGSRRNAELFHTADPEAMRRRDTSIRADAAKDSHGFASDENWLFNYDAVNIPLVARSGTG